MVLATPLFTQSFMDNPDYVKAKELQKMAQDAFDSGDYDSAYSQSEEAKDYLKKSDAYVSITLLKYRANTLINFTADRLGRSRSSSGEGDAEIIQKAEASLDAARKSYTAEQYETSIESSRLALSLLDGLAGVSARPKFYTVRLIAERRDCFWRIAEYEFVYGDPWKWRLLYEANKDKLGDPGNPGLIEPGLIIEIPSLAGERREGSYQSEE